MPQGPPPDPIESVTLGRFSGIKNTVSSERLGPEDLERALNIDLDDSGQVRRRRGFALKDSSRWHSVRGPLAGKTYGVKDGVLGIIRPDYSFFSLGVPVGDVAVCYAEIANDVYFSGPLSGVIHTDETVGDWGATDGQGTWLSPVLTPTDTLGEISGQLLGDPPRATSIEPYKGRIYLAQGKTQWATELYRYHYVDRTRGFTQYEHDITLQMAVADGMYIGTTGGLYFIQGVFGSFKLTQLVDDPVLPGSGVWVPTDLVHPQARNQAVPTGIAAVMMTTAGILAGFDGGTCYNLTQGRVVFPIGISAAALFRQDQGANSYVAAVDSAGGLTANTRIGDFIDVEHIRGGVRI